MHVRQRLRRSRHLSQSAPRPSRSLDRAGDVAEISRGARRGARPPPCSIRRMRSKWSTNAVDTSKRLLRCYTITSGVVGQVSEYSGRGGCWHELVPVERQTWLAAGAICAGGPVCAFVRAFPRRCGAGRAGDSIRRGATRIFHHRFSAGTRCGHSICSAGAARLRPQFRPADQRPLRDLRRHGAGQHRLGCDAAAVAAAASRRFPVPDDRRRVRPSELHSCRVSASRAAGFLTSNFYQPRRSPRPAWRIRESKLVRRISTASAFSEFVDGHEFGGSFSGLG
jgi:hypothetical protein